MNGENKSSELEKHTEALRATLKSQYHAGLAMLRETIELCPDELWFSKEHQNAYWQIAYHALFFTHAYLQRHQDDFRPWEGQQSDVQNPDCIPGPADPASTLPLIPERYTRAEVLKYWDFCDRMVDGAVDAMDLHSPESGFWRYKISKLEHQMINLRHLAHHTAQLADRLRFSQKLGVKWVGARRGKQASAAG